VSFKYSSFNARLWVASRFITFLYNFSYLK
jgi:hypothetical protein